MPKKLRFCGLLLGIRGVGGGSVKAFLLVTIFLLEVCMPF